MRPGGWRDLVTVLHPPYTAWNLANVAFGAAAATEIHTDRFVATNSLRPFIWYRVALGLFVAVALVTGWMTAT